jgi:hypothetical protein
MVLGWFKRERDTRALRLTAEGTAGLRDVFGVAFEGTDAPRSHPLSSPAVDIDR